MNTISSSTSSTSLFQNVLARLAVTLAAMFFVGLFGQKAIGQNTQAVSVSVQELNKVIVPGGYTLEIDPASDNDFVGTGVAQGYKVLSNSPNGKAVEISVTGVNSASELESLSIVASGTDAPGQASVTSDVQLITGGAKASNLPQNLTGSFTGVKSGFLPVEYKGEVSPDFSPNQTSTSVTIQYTLVQP